jgi:hypothetical protein
MNRVNQFAAVAVLMASGLAVLPGCQNAGRRDTTDRTVPASVTYDRAYTATRDTEWVSAPGGTRNPLPRGTRVYFSSAPGSTEWQQARVENRGVVYVRPADFTAEAR